MSTLVAVTMAEKITYKKKEELTIQQTDNYARLETQMCFVY
jgi:hypothetical protein